MMKSLAPLAILALLGASMVALPLFAPQVKANETPVLRKADRLAIQPAVRDCASQVWPDFDTSCLRQRNTDIRVREARLVTARR
jgi:hypothetical protein